MGKKAKEHRKKVAKRNAKIKLQEKAVEKFWEEAFKKMGDMGSMFESMSGDTTSADTASLITGLLKNEEHLQQENQQEESESVEPIQGE